MSRRKRRSAEQPDGSLKNAADAGAAEEASEIDLSDQLDSEQPFRVIVESRAHGWRLDHYLSRLFANHSRAQLKKSIDSQSVLVNGLPCRAGKRLRINDYVDIQLPDAEQSHFQPEDIPLSILFEDESMVVVNKPPNMVVHPGRGSMSGTLTSALQFHFDQLSDVGGQHRPGIVHRLDRDTTGVIVVARNNQVHQKISSQFEQRTVTKEYRAIVRGEPEMEADYIRTHVCVHNRVREKMMVCSPSDRSREAVTFYTVAERLNGFALMHLKPQTGRTHQLRVHMQHIGCPILADRLYTGETEFCVSQLPSTQGSGRSGDRTAPGEVLISRQALHAFRLSIRHPVSDELMTFEAPLPDDFQNTLNALRSASLTQ